VDADGSRGAGTALSDLAVGLRLALGGGRTTWLRLGLTAVGIGLCALVLLLAASIGPAMQTRDTRAASLTPRYPAIAGPLDQPADGSANPIPALTEPGVFQANDSDIPYHGLSVVGFDLAAVDPGSASPPPGVERFPEPGQLLLSPALADLLASADGAQLRERLPGERIGLIGDNALLGPEELRFYRGASLNDPLYGEGIAVGWGSRSGFDYAPDSVSPYITVLLTAGTAIVIVPLLIFVSLMSRVGGAGRDRRSAAIRLMGASRAQLSRITLVEPAVAAVAGLLLGGIGFVIARPFVARLRFGSTAFFPADLSPTLVATVLIVVAVPLLAIFAVWLGTRRALIEPLGVVRRTRPTPRRIWWRLALLASGLLLMLGSLFSGALFGAPGLIGLPTYALALAVVLLLVSVPVLLPLALEKVATALPTTDPAWQLAVRRLQSEPGVASRVVAGVSVVRAGAIALQSLLIFGGAPSTTNAGLGAPAADYRIYVRSPTSADLATVADAITATGEISTMAGGVPIGATLLAGSASAAAVRDHPETASWGMVIAPCVAIAAPRCQDGDVFATDSESAAGAPSDGQGSAGAVRVGARVVLDSGIETSVEWTVPELAGTVPDTFFRSRPTSLVITPGALGADADAIMAASNLDLRIPAAHPSSATADRLRTAFAGMTWRATVETSAEFATIGTRGTLTETARTGVILGATLTLLVAAAGLLVMAVEQLTERRRALTLTIAAGVPRSLIARSLIIGAAIPLLVGVVLADIVGCALALFLLELIGQPWGIDVAAVAVYSGVAVLVVMVTTVAVLPVVARLTRPDAIRTG